MREFKILRFINRHLPSNLQIIKWHFAKDAPDENLPVFTISVGKRMERCIFKNNKYISVLTGEEVPYVIWWCYE